MGLLLPLLFLVLEPTKAGNDRATRAKLESPTSMDTNEWTGPIGYHPNVPKLKVGEEHGAQRSV